MIWILTRTQELARVTSKMGDLDSMKVAAEIHLEDPVGAIRRLLGRTDLQLT
jgi:hypothetical protein